jgi:hypothetical protein
VLSSHAAFAAKWPEAGQRRRVASHAKGYFDELGLDVTLATAQGGDKSARGDAACIMLLEMNGAGIGHEGLYVTSLIDRSMGWHKRADEFADTLKIASIFSRHTLDRYGGRF